MALVNLSSRPGARDRTRVTGPRRVPPTPPTATPSATGLDRVPSGTVRRLLGGIRAWMVVLPVDFVMLTLPALWNPGTYRAILATGVVALVLLSDTGRYRARLHLSVLDELPALTGRVLAAAGLIATLLVLRGDETELIIYMRNIAVAIGLMLLGRVVTSAVINWSRSRRLTVHRTVLIGGGALAAELTTILDQHRRYGLQVVGFVDERADCLAGTPTERLGRLDDLDDAVTRTGSDVILIADGGVDERKLLDAVRTPATAACDVLIVPRMPDFHTQTGMADHVGSIPVMRIRTPALSGPTRLVKRLVDVLVAGAALVLVSPVLLACAVAVRIEGGPGVIFRQARVGRNGEQFDCFKLRSMRPVDETESATNWNVSTDKRVGPVGRVLRRTSLDELPQLWNILRGDMTLVGPRPERPHFVDQFSVRFHRYAHRHRVQAGLTGFAQVSGLRGDTSIADRARFDNYYIEHWTLWLDIKIILRTFGEVLFARGR